MRLLFSSLLFFCIISLSACGPRPLNFQLSFKDIHELKKGDPLMHDAKVIGEVKKIIYTEDSTFIVDVIIQPENKHLATTSALFYIDKNTETQTKLIELVNGNSENADFIGEDTLVVGSDKLKGVSQGLSNKFSEAINSLSSDINKAWKNWQEKTIEKQLTHLEEELDKIISQFQELGKESQRQLQEEVIPQLKQQINILRKKLESLGRDEELDNIEEKLKNVDELTEV